LTNNWLIEALLDSNADLEEQLQSCEEQNDELLDALQTIWSIYAKEHPEQVKELTDKYVILGELRC
jgi:hypothetical protein